jgi:N-acetylated-alpha-linked acidic dipeptidase
MKRQTLLFIAALLVCGLLAPVSVSQETPIRGFSSARVAPQRALEQKLQSIPSAESAERYLRFLTAEPHMVGTEGSRRVAEYVRAQLRSYGFEADLVRYSVWLPHPREVKLELIAPQKKPLATQEEPIAADKDSSNPRIVPGFNAYSPSGEVSGSVVYANYGQPEDFRRLAELGISIEGKIVLARYGRNFRGVKARVAEEYKAAGLIIYSDPADDGYVAGDAYPRGPWRPMSGIQRGSILYTFHYPGDPLTPETASTENARRLDPAQARSLPRIPTMPISPRDAQEILKHLNGPRVREWQGGLPLTYHVGPGNARVRMKLAMDYQQRTLYNVVARLRGTNENEWVVMGNHHDAWVFGAVDPSSGTAVMLETARALGELVRAGWKPRRTILLCAWDGEETGLLGSTEWVEENIEELRRKAVAYFNMDSAVSGPNFGGAATPSLREFVREVSREVPSTRAGVSVYEAWRQRVRRASQEGLDRQGREVPLGSLGAGSDFTPFYHHGGIPSFDMSSGGDYGVYHSMYDSFHWMKSFGDPGFQMHATMARIAGIALLRLADADVLPFDYEEYAEELQRYVADLEGVANAKAEGKLPLAELRETVAAFAASAGRANRALATTAGSAALNRALVLVEQDLLAPAGLSDRPWYKHTVVAPGAYAGYAAVLFPGVREPLDRGDWETARRELTVLVAALRRATARLDEVARLAGQ